MAMFTVILNTISIYEKIVNVGNRFQTTKTSRQQTVKPNWWHTFRQNKSLNHWPVPGFKYTTYWLIGIAAPGTTNDELCDFSTGGGTGRPVQRKTMTSSFGSNSNKLDTHEVS